MNSEDFNKCREFLETQISNSHENRELLNIYQKLIELKSEHDKETQKAMIEKEVREAEQQKQYYSTVHTNNTQFDMKANDNWAATQQNYQSNSAATQQNWHNQQAGAFNNVVDKLPPSYLRPPNQGGI